MKFNIRLDEDLFDDFESESSRESFSFDDFDDDFIDYEDEHKLEDVLPGPAEGPDTGVASELISLINDEWEAIQGYNNAIASLRANVSANPFYEDAIKVLSEISAEENVHVGQLQEILKHISPNASEITKGTKEARTQLGFVGGVLPVQSWGDSNNKLNSDPSLIEDEICDLCDIDDEM